MLVGFKIFVVYICAFTFVHFSPKCRKEYPKSATPQKYYCFCKKQVGIKMCVLFYEFILIVGLAQPSCRLVGFATFMW